MVFPGLCWLCVVGEVGASSVRVSGVSYFLACGVLWCRGATCAGPRVGALALLGGRVDHVRLGGIAVMGRARGNV